MWALVSYVDENESLKENNKLNTKLNSISKTKHLELTLF